MVVVEESCENKSRAAFHKKCHFQVEILKIYKNRISNFTFSSLSRLPQLKDVFRTVDLVGVEHLSISFGAILEGEADF